MSKDSGGTNITRVKKDKEAIMAFLFFFSREIYNEYYEKNIVYYGGI